MQFHNKSQSKTKKTSEKEDIYEAITKTIFNNFGKKKLQEDNIRCDKSNV